MGDIEPHASLGITSEELIVTNETQVSQCVSIGRMRIVAIVIICPGFAFRGPNRSSILADAGPAARIHNLGPNATNGAICATRREAVATGFDCGAGSDIG
jgi:hypothetical protein